MISRFNKKLFWILFVWLLLVGCSISKDDRKRYQWDIEKATSMQNYLLNKGVDDIELDNKIYEYYNKIERVSIELDNHSH